MDAGPPQVAPLAVWQVDGAPQAPTHATGQAASTHCRLLCCPSAATQAAPVPAAGVVTLYFCVCWPPLGPQLAPLAVAQVDQAPQAPTQATGHTGNTHDCVTGDVGHALPLCNAGVVIANDWLCWPPLPHVAPLGPAHVDQADQVPAQSCGTQAGIWHVDVCTKPCACGQAEPVPTAGVDTAYVEDDEPDTPHVAEAAQVVGEPNAPTQLTGHTGKLHCWVLTCPLVDAHVAPPFNAACAIV